MSVGKFHRSLRSRGKGAKDWSNSWTEHEYLGVNEEGKHSYGVNLSVEHRVFKDKEDGQWKKHKLTDNRPTKDYILVQGAKCCVEVYPYYAKFFDVHHEEVRLHEERWVIQRLFKEPDTWRDIDAYNPVMATEAYSEPTGDVIKVTITYETGYGPFILEYSQREGSALKHSVYFTNESGVEETFRVLQRWAGIVGSKCNGKDFPLEIMGVEASYLAFHSVDNPSRKFNIAENLWSMIYNLDGTVKMDKCLLKPVKIEGHAQGMKTDFIYAQWILGDGESLEIDPDTVTLNNPTIDAYIDKTGASYTRIDGTSMNIGFFLAGGNTWRAYIEWDVSTIPDGSTITDTVFRYEGAQSDIDCHIHEMVGTRPSTQPDNDAGNQAIYDEAGEGTIYADPAGFPVLAQNQSVDLGASADSDLAAQLALDWFAIGIQSDNEGSNNSSAIWSETYVGPPVPPPTLYVVYTPGWSGKISGVTDPAKIMGVAKANIAEVKGVA